MGGVFHTLPFLINSYHAAIIAAIITVAVELVVLAVIRAQLLQDRLPALLRDRHARRRHHRLRERGARQRGLSASSTVMNMSQR